MGRERRSTVSTPWAAACCWKTTEKHDRRFRELLNALFQQVVDLRGSLGRERVVRLESAVLISSAATITPFHFDPEVNLFAQIEGEKVYHVFSPSALTESELERFYVRGVVNIGQVQLKYRDPAQTLRRPRPGQGPAPAAKRPPLGRNPQNPGRSPTRLCLRPTPPPLGATSGPSITTSANSASIPRPFLASAGGSTASRPAPCARSSPSGRSSLRPWKRSWDASDAGRRVMAVGTDPLGAHLTDAFRRLHARRVSSTTMLSLFWGTAVWFRF